MSTPGTTGNLVQYTTQYIDNMGFDDLLKVPVVEIVGYDSVNQVARRLLVNAQGALSVEVGTTVLNGQVKVAVTNTAVQLSGTQTVKNGVIIQALAANAGNVVIGSSSVTTSNGFQLQAGQATSIAVNDLSTLYVNGTANDGVCYIAST